MFAIPRGLSSLWKFVKVERCVVQTVIRGSSEKKFLTHMLVEQHDEDATFHRTNGTFWSPLKVAAEEEYEFLK